jgi:exoribonuclease R
MDTIELNGLFYKLSKDTRTDFTKNELYYKILPGDSVSYNKLDNGQVIIESILDRTSRLTIGILDSRLRLLRLPIESKIFKTQINYISKTSCNSCLCLVLVNKDDYIIVKEYGSIKERKYDLEICQETYKDINQEFNNIYTNLINSIKYTVPFYSNNVQSNKHLHTFNIDPTHSLDFDDAISIDIENNRLYIHIVDININLLYNNFENQALALGSTLYLPEGNLNIIPNDYSENYFSLVEGQIRHVITLEIQLDESGDGIDYKIYRDNIIIKHRYDYNTAQQALEDGEKHLVFLDKLLQNPKWIYSKLNLPKRTIRISNGFISDIEISHQNRINKIVESLMIMTNRTITTHLIDVAPERFHEESNINKIPILSLNDPILNIEFLRKYKTAKYSNVDTGHFALDIPHYTHFTSPIRRSFDILIHNILSGVIYGDLELDAMIKHINSRETLNKKLVDFYEKCKLLSYFSTYKVPYSFRVSRVTKVGIHIFIEKLVYTEFIHISKIIPNVRWTFVESTSDPSNNKLVGVNNHNKDKQIVIEKLSSGTIIFNTINWLDLCADTFKITLNN